MSQPSNAARRAAEATSPEGAIEAWIEKQAAIIDRETGIAEARELIERAFDIADKHGYKNFALLARAFLDKSNK